MVKRVVYLVAIMVRIQQERGAYLDLVNRDLLVFLAPVVAGMVFLDKLRVRFIVVSMDYAMAVATA